MKKIEFELSPYLGTKRKLLLIMKLTFLLTVVCFLQTSATVYSQATKFSFELKNQRIQDVLREIEKNSDFRFFYQREQVDVEQIVTLNITDKTVEEILPELFKGQEVVFDVRQDNLILIKPEKGAIESSTEFYAQQQQNSISGKVTDSRGQPLPGVTVVVKGTSTGTVTNTDGNFTLTIPNDVETLQFSFVGMQTQEVSIDGRTMFTVVMEEETIGLEEVVAIGYGTQKRANLTSSISKITDEAMKERPITNVGEALQGQLAGVRAQSTAGGVPGREMTIRIRGMNTINGSSEPLYVIDGVPRDNMSDINPNDIATIQILKDASASSIYGSRGGNGVVLIETKRGKGKPTVTFEGYYGISNAEKKLDLMNGEEWVAWNMFRRNLNHLRTGGSMSDPMSARSASNQIPDSWPSVTNFTDWQDAVLQNAPIQNYQVSASAAGDIGNIYFSAGYLNQDGIIKYSYYKRKNIRLNSTININPKLKVGVDLAASDSERDDSDADGGSNGNGKESSVHHALMLTPLMQLNEGTRDWGFPANVGTTYPNPVEQQKYTLDNNKNTRIATNIWGEFTIVDNLVFKSQYSYNYDGYTYEFFQPGNVTYNNGNVSIGNSNATTTGNWVFQNTLSYNNLFGDHQISLLLGQSAEERRYYRIYAAASGWPYESIETLNVATTPTSATTNRTTYTNASFFGRANYDFKEKYLVSASIRADGSSRFGSNAKWGYFPSLSVGWKINEEAFLQDADWISLLKVRAAFGSSGNDRIGDYAYLALLGINNTSWGNEVVSGVAPNRIANEDLQWESTKTLDFGIDYSAFNNRIQLNLDYYINTTDNLLFSVPIPYTTGFSSFTTNVGSIENRGWEIDLTTYNVKGEFNWTTNFNFSRNRNEVLDMGDIDLFTSTSWDAQFITKVGGPVSQFYVYRTDGILKPSDFDANGKALVPILAGQEVGNVKYVDQNDDKIINSLDYAPYGNNLPDVIYGMTNRFSWKNFDLSVLIQGQVGGDVLFLGSRQYDNGGMNGNGFNRWLRSYKIDYETMYGSGENPIPKEYLEAHGIDFSWDGKTINPVGVNNNNDDRRIYDASYLRIKNITLGYNVPGNLLKNSLINDIRCYVSLDNVKTFDNYPGYTPETNSFGNSTTMMGIDYSTYPLSRRLIFGLNLVF